MLVGVGSIASSQPPLLHTAKTLRIALQLCHRPDAWSQHLERCIVAPPLARFVVHYLRCCIHCSSAAGEIHRHLARCIEAPPSSVRTTRSSTARRQGSMVLQHHRLKRCIGASAAGEDLRLQYHRLKRCTGASTAGEDLWLQRHMCALNCSIRRR